MTCSAIAAVHHQFQRFEIGRIDIAHQMIGIGIQNGDLLILDLFSECRPMWGIPSIWKRDKGYEQHNWLFCMLLNFGGNVGLHGRMDQLLDNFYLTKNNPLAVHLKGIGLTELKLQR